MLLFLSDPADDGRGFVDFECVCVVAGGGFIDFESVCVLVAR